MFLLRLFFAPQCPICDRTQEDENICSSCFSKLRFLSMACKKCQEPFKYKVDGVDICLSCSGKNLNFYDEMRCALVYNETLKNMIVNFKNHACFYLSKIFAKFIINKCPDFFHKNALIIPVPLHKKRLLWRGYNQSLILARAIAKLEKIQCENLLVRYRNTNSQAMKTIKERETNVKNAFEILEHKKYLVKDRDIILLDDVITTGATTLECAKILAKYQPKSIKIIAIGRRLKRS